MIDIGANLTDPVFHEDRDDVLSRAHDAGVVGVIITGTSTTDSAHAARLAQRHPHLWSTAGVHPHDAKSVDPNWLGDLEKIAKTEEKVIAIGETGLDFKRNFSPPEVQREIFSKQIELAQKLNLPLFVHDRDSEGETARLLMEHAAKNVVIHCFTGSRKDLDTYLNAGFSIGITGWVCDERRGLDLAELVQHIPDEKLMIETDAPYLLPRTIQPRPSSRRNEPAFLSWIANTIANLRHTSIEHVIDVTSMNAKKLFGLYEAKED